MSARISRRFAIGAAASIAAIAVAVREIPAIVRALRTRRTPYDDLLAAIDDREAAETIGRYALKSVPDFDRAKTAELLRARLHDSDLKQLTAAELSTGQTVEIAGWVFPRSLALMCALAAIA